MVTMNPNIISQVALKDKQTLNIQKSAIFSDVFGLSNIYRRLERLSVATYAITDFFPEAEPLKWSLRQSIGQLLKDTTNLIIVSGADKGMSFKRISAGLIELASYYELSFNSRLTSTMNFELIYAEIAKVATLFGNLENAITHQTSVIGTSDLARDFFNISEEEEVENVAMLTQGDKVKISLLNERGTGAKTDIIKDNIKDNIKDKQIKTIIKFKSNNASQTVNLVKDIRFQKILSLLKPGKQLGIQDLVAEIKGCSSKTIQRDLQELVEQGRVKRQGEKRWSVYSI